MMGQAKLFKVMLAAIPPIGPGESRFKKTSKEKWR